MGRFKENPSHRVFYIWAVSGILAFNPGIGLASFMNHSSFALIFLFSVLYLVMDYFFAANKPLAFMIFVLLFLAEYTSSSSNLCILIPKRITLGFLVIGTYCAVVDGLYLLMNRLPVFNGNLRPVFLNVFMGSTLQLLFIGITALSGRWGKMLHLP